MPAPTLKAELNKVERPPRVEYSEAEIKYRSYLIDRMTKAKKQRDQNHTYFDGMTYQQYYESNEKADLAYVPPKKNQQDVRVTTNTTSEKGTTVLSAILNFDFNINVKGFDENDEEVFELGEQFEALIEKSRDIEEPDYEVKRVLILQEALRQGTAFVEDWYHQGWEVDKEMDDVDWAGGVSMNMKWKRNVRRAYGKLSTNLISGLNMYLGNIYTFHMCKQPFIFMRKYMSVDEAESIFGSWERWKHVPRDLSSFDEGTGQDSTTYSDWTLGTFKEGMVEIVIYQDKWKNDFMIMLNGVMMLPIEFPLSQLTGVSEYTVVKLDVQPMSENFAYSKSIPAKTKVDQQILDELYKLLILQYRQKVFPSMANLSNKRLDRRIFWPAVIINDMNPDELRPILENQGVTNAEFSVIDFVKKTIDEKSVNQTFQGQQMPGQQTAREIVELQKQSLMKLGLIVLGVIAYEKDLAYLRLRNIVKYWPNEKQQKVDEMTGKLVEINKTVRIPDTFKDGEAGTRVIEFTDDIQDSEQLFAEEEFVRQFRNKNIRKVQLSPIELLQMRLTWKVEVEPTEKDSDALERTLFLENLTQALQLFPGRVNMEYIMSEYSKHAGWDKEQVFVEAPAPNPVPPEGGAGGVLANSAAPQVQQPSVNTLMQG